MTLLEAEPKEIDEVGRKMAQIMDAAPSSNYMHRQIQLAAERFAVRVPGEILDAEKRDEIMELWKQEYSKVFGDICKHEGFKNHPRFKGDISNITMEDVEKFKETGELPEN